MGRNDTLLAPLGSWRRSRSHRQLGRIAIGPLGSVCAALAEVVGQRPRLAGRNRSSGLGHVPAPLSRRGTGWDKPTALRSKSPQVIGRQLGRYLENMSHVLVTSLNPAEQFAYWVNLYNALTVKVVLDHYPVASIRDITLGGSFLRQFDHRCFGALAGKADSDRRRGSRAR